VKLAELDGVAPPAPHPPVAHPSASFSATLRVRLPNEPGSFARLAEAIGRQGGLLGAIDVVRAERKPKVRDVTVLASDAADIDRIVSAPSTRSTGSR
jgi:malate dehydrogenase (oxaloacetate-decarboxylating)